MERSMDGADEADLADAVGAPRGSVPRVGMVSMTALGLLLAAMMNCGENYTYFVDQKSFNMVQANPDSASPGKPLQVRAVREQDQAQVVVVASTFRTGEQVPLPPRGYVRVRNLGSRHPAATAGYIMLGVGLAVDIIGAALAVVGLNNSGNITEGHAGSPLLGPGIILGLTGNLTWLAGIPTVLAGVGRHVAEVPPVPRQITRPDPHE